MMTNRHLCNNDLDFCLTFNSILHLSYGSFSKKTYPNIHVLQENQRIELEAQREDILTRNAIDKEDTLSRHTQEKSDLEEELAATCRDRDDSLMFAENEKQQALSLLEQEKSTLAEKLSATAADLQNTRLDLDRSRMEGATKAEQDKTRYTIYHTVILSLSS